LHRSRHSAALYHLAAPSPLWATLFL
jgi:hypothetical protein